MMADNTNLLKKCLDKFRLLKDFVHLFRAQPLEDGSVKLIISLEFSVLYCKF